MRSSFSPQAGAIVCDTPSTPINESLRILSAESSFTEGSEIVLQCDDGLLPSHPRTATCVQVLGRGEWVPNPADVLCEERNFTNDKIIATCNVNRHAEWPNPIIMLISHNPPRK